MHIVHPISVEFITADGVFIKQTVIKDSGTLLPQHSHVWDHTTLVAKGSVSCWKNGTFDRIYVAPSTIFIRAGVKHLFQTLEDDTILYCIHNLHDKEKVAILEEHELSA
jgi:quercetin dioxygenase-like cupin family protein